MQQVRTSGVVPFDRRQPFGSRSRTRIHPGIGMECQHHVARAGLARRDNAGPLIAEVFDVQGAQIPEHDGVGRQGLHLGDERSGVLALLDADDAEALAGGPGLRPDAGQLVADADVSVMRAGVLEDGNHQPSGFEAELGVTEPHVGRDAVVGHLNECFQGQVPPRAFRILLMPRFESPFPIVMMSWWSWANSSGAALPIAPHG